MSPEMNLLVTVLSLAAFGLFLSLAHASEREGGRPLRAFVYLLVSAALATMGLIGGLLAAAGPMAESGLIPTDEAAPGAAGFSFEDEAFTAAIGQSGFWMLGLALLGFLLLLPFVRRILARIMPIDPDRPVHAVALQYGLLLVLVSAMTGIFIGLAIDKPEAFPIEDLSGGADLSVLWGQALGFVVIAFLGVGWGVKRGFRESLERLGLIGSFAWRWWIAMTLLALGAGFLVDQLWAFTSPDTLEGVERISDALFGDLMQTGLPGVLTIGLSAGIGEEILFRGAAQPRFGLVATSLLFAAIHTQYSVSPALIQIFAVGMLLGITRQRVGTTTAIGVHATYNAVLAVISMCDQSVLSCPW